MAITVTSDAGVETRAERMTRNYGFLSGSFAADTSYPTSGWAAAAITKHFVSCKHIDFTDTGGYLVVYDKSADTIMAYLPSGTPAVGAGTSHTHAFGSLADAASAAGSSHTHAFGSLADAASAAGSSHTHGMTGSSVDAEAAHTHAFGSLADAASAAGSSHTHAFGSLADAASAAGSSHDHALSGSTAAGASHDHVFTGTALTTEAVDITHNADPGTPGVAVYLHTKDGTTGWFEFVSPTNADGVVDLNNGGSKVMVFDSDNAATDGIAIYFDEDGATADERILAACPLGLDVLVPTSIGTLIRIKYNATPDTPGNQVYLDEDAATAYDRLLFISPTTSDGTATTDDTYRGMMIVPAGDNAAEATHTHAVGSLDAAAEAAHTHAVALDGGATAAEAAHTHAVALDGGATAVGASHTHGMTTATTDAETAHTHAVALDGGATAAEAAHTHAVALDGGATAAEAAHTHTATGEAADEVGSGANLSTPLAAVRFVAFGTIDY